MPKMFSFIDIIALLSYADIMLYNARSLRRLAIAVKGLRKARGLTQAELSMQAKTSRQWLIALESGQNPRLELGLLLRTLDALDASLYIRDDQGAGDDR
jgi:transcriptional regulator with XRE-family HTH domain